MNFRTSNNPHFCTNLWFLGVQNDPHNILLLRDHSICGEKLVWCVGAYSPYIVYPNCGMCDSESFGHVFKTHKSNPIIRVYELANLFNCRHSKNRLFEFVCQQLESPKLIQFRILSQNVSISPFVLRENWFVAWNRGFQFICRRDVTCGSENADLPPTARATSCYGAETLGNNIYVRRETLRVLLVFCTGPVLVHSAALLSTNTSSLHKPRHQHYYDTVWHW
jgi:hypothetical protein